MSFSDIYYFSTREDIRRKFSYLLKSDLQDHIHRDVQVATFQDFGKQSDIESVGFCIPASHLNIDTLKHLLVVIGLLGHLSIEIFSEKIIRIMDDQNAIIRRFFQENSIVIKRTDLWTESHNYASISPRSIPIQTGVTCSACINLL
jgi:hypothetical protein